MRILMLTPDFPPEAGGIQMLAYGIAKWLPETDTQVVTVATPQARAFDSSEPLRVLRVPRTGGHKAALARLNAAGLRVAWQTKPDAVLAMHVVVTSGALAAHCATGAPSVQYLHAAEMSSYPGLTRRAVLRADLCIAVSRYTRGLALAAGASAQRVEVIPPGFTPPTRVAASANRRRLVTSVSRLVERYKGHDVLIRAFPLVRSRAPGAMLAIIGDGPLRPSLEKLVVAHGLEDVVTFTGAIADAERDALLDRAQVFALPSRLPGGRFAGEGFGMVFLEAAGRGLPVVAGNLGGTVDAVEDGRTGLLVDATDHVAVADALADLLLDQGRARAYGETGAERAQAFAWPLIGARLRKVLEQIVQ